MNNIKIPLNSSIYNNSLEINKNYTNKDKLEKKSISESNKNKSTEYEASKKLRSENSTNITSNQKLTNITKDNNNTNASNSIVNESLFFENFTEPEENNDAINKKINNEFNITDNDINSNYDNFTLPNFVLLNYTDSDKLLNTTNNNSFVENKTIQYTNQNNQKGENKIENFNNSSSQIKTIENFPLSVFNNNDIFEDRNFELYLLNKKKQESNNSYINDMLGANNDFNQSQYRDLTEMQMDDLSEKFKIYLENTKKQKNEFEQAKNNFKLIEKNRTFNESTKNKNASDIIDKNQNSNKSLMIFPNEKNNNTFNFTMKNLSFNNKNETIIANKSKFLIKSRKLIADDKSKKENKLKEKDIVQNNKNTSSINNYYDSNFLAYTKSKKNLGKKNEVIIKATNNSTIVSNNDQKNENKSKNKHSKATKKTEGQIINILFSLILIAFILAGLCWLIFLMFMKTNKN